MPTKQENRGEIGIDLKNNHIAASGTDSVEAVLEQMALFAKFAAITHGTQPEKVTVLEYLHFFRNQQLASSPKGKHQRISTPFSS